MFTTLKKFGVNIARYIRAFIFTCLNLEVFINCGLVLLSTYLTSKDQWDVRYRLDNVFLTVALISPLTSVIALAYTRRDSAAEQLAQLQANCLNLYMLHRDWHRPVPGDLSMVGDNNTEHAQQLAALIGEFFAAVKTFLLRKGAEHESRAENKLTQLSTLAWLHAMLRNKIKFANIRDARPDVEGKYQELHEEDNGAELDKDLYACYQKINQLFMWNEMRYVAWGNKQSGNAGMPIRTNTLLGAIVNNFEQLRLIHDYRTPVMLRYGTKILIYVYAILLGPSMNLICDSYESYEKEKKKARELALASASSATLGAFSSGASSVVNGTMGGVGVNDSLLRALGTSAAANLWEIPCMINYLVATLLLVSVTVFVRIGSDLEYPFDLKGLDDIVLDPEEEFRAYLRSSPSVERKQKFFQLVDADKQHKD